MYVLHISTGVILISLILIAIGYLNKIRSLIVIGIYIICLTGIFGFGIFGMAIPAKTELIKPSTIQYHKFTDRVVIIVDDVVGIYKEVEIYNNIEKYNILIKKEYNSYKILIGTGIKLEKNIK